jgi:hypothetical protein
MKKNPKTLHFKDFANCDGALPTSTPCAQTHTHNDFALFNSWADSSQPAPACKLAKLFFEELRNLKCYTTQYLKRAAVKLYTVPL